MHKCGDLVVVRQTCKISITAAAPLHVDGCEQISTRSHHIPACAALLWN